MSSKEHADDLIPEGHVQRGGMKDTIQQIGTLDFCPECGAPHQAVYSHEGRFGEGPIYAVVCSDGLTSYFTLEVVTL